MGRIKPPDLESDSENLRLVLGTLKAFAARWLTDGQCLELDRAERFPEELIREMMGAELGFHLVFLPEDVGGLGFSAHEVARFSETLAGMDLGVATAFLATALGTDPLIRGATEAQRTHWLGRVAREGLIVAYGVTEPEAGSNVSALKTRAERVHKGGQVVAYRLSGTKQFITNASVAELYTILAQTPEGPSFFLVTRNSPGLSLGPPEKKHGIRCSDTAQVNLEEVMVPAGQLLGAVEGQGLIQANSVFAHTRLMVAAFGLGAGEAALRRAVAHARERIQFGGPLLEKQGFTHRLLLPHLVRLAAARAYIYEIAGRLDQGEQELMVESSIAKLLATEAGNSAAEASIQALGGYGYCREYLVEKIKRDVRITTIYEGTSEIQLNIIGTYRWRHTVRSKGAFYSDLAVEMKESSPRCGAELIASAAELLNASIGFAHRHRLTRRQHLLFMLAESCAGVEAAAALARRAESPESCAMARIYSREILEKLLGCAWRMAHGVESLPRAERAAFMTQVTPDIFLRGLVGDLADQDFLAGSLQEDRADLFFS